MSGEEFLVSQRGANGEEYLVTTPPGPDGETLLASSPGCANCCPSSCARIRKYIPCDLPANLRPCVSTLGHIWACEPAICPLAIHYANQCWTPTGVVIPIDQKPAQDILVDNPPECSPGCNDPRPDHPCTACQLFYEATPCPGSNNCGRIFVPVEFVTGCSLVHGAGPNCCYTVNLGATITSGEIPAGSFITPTADYVSLGSDCCDCVAGCAGHSFVPYYDCSSGTPLVYGPCCCTAAYTLTMDFDYSVTAFSGDGSRTEWRMPHQHVVRESTNFGVPAVPFTMTQTDFGTHGEVLRVVEVSGGVLPVWHCGEWASFAFGDPLDEQKLCPSENNDPRLACSVMRTATCTNAAAIGSWTYIDPANPPGTRLVYSVTIRQSIVQHGPCAGGCGSGGIPGTPGTTLPITPLPLEQWPQDVSSLAATKATTDKGFGDTLTRFLANKGGNAIKEWVAAHKLDCGCADRAAWLNRMFPYR